MVLQSSLLFFWNFVSFCQQPTFIGTWTLLNDTSIRKSECVSKSGEKVFFCTKLVILFRNCFSLALSLSRVLEHQTPIKFCCYYESPRSEPHEVRNCRETAVPEKETKILEKGAHSDRAHLAKGKPSTRPFKRALVRFSGTLSCEDFKIQKFSIKFCENLQKHPGQLGLTSQNQSSFDTAKNTFLDISCCKTIRLSCFWKFIGNLIFGCFTLINPVVLQSSLPFFFNFCFLLPTADFVKHIFVSTVHWYLHCFEWHKH